MLSRDPYSDYIATVIGAIVPILTEQLVKDTVDLIAIDSQNPGPQESACAEWIEQRLRRARVPVVRQPVSEGRTNLIAALKGAAEGPRLVLLAHMDTVPIGHGWSYPPLAGVIKGSRIIGRGAADMKSGLAVAINLMEMWSAGAAPLPCDVVLCATVDEEAPDMLGAHALVRDSLVGPGDQVLALEPTGLRLRLAQLGLRWFTLTIRGRMAHAGRPELGVDAIHAMARVVNEIYSSTAALPYRDPVLGRPKVTCSIVAGGTAPNVVSAESSATLDFRLVPPMTAETVARLTDEITQGVLADFPGSSYSLEPLGVTRPPVAASEDSHLVRMIRAAFEDVTGSVLPSGGSDGHEAYTDASMVAALTGSQSCTVFGPGSTDVAHTADESVDIGEMEIVAAVLDRMVQWW